MKSILRLSLAWGAILLIATGAQAANIYNLTQNQSQLNLTVGGTVLGGTATVTEQQANATTRYNGNMAVAFPGTPAVGGSIAFPGGGAAAAVNPTGLFSIPLQFTPNVNGAAGSAAANYGVTIAAPVNIVVPVIPIPVEGQTINLDLGTLESFSMTMAVRNLVLDVESNAISIGAGGTFDPAGTSLSIVSGFADINGALVFKQADILSNIAAGVALNALAAAVPDLGLTVSTNLLNRTVSLGLGTRVDLAGAGDTLLPNLATTPGTVSWVNQQTQSNLLLPVNINLPSFSELGLPADILDLQLSLSGQLRGTGFITEVPEPSSVVLALFGLASVGLLGRRRKTK